VTGRRTGGVTQQLVIPLWTLRPAVTQLVAMETHTGRSAAVVTRTRDVITGDLVLTSRTVLDPVTPEVDRQAVHVLTRTVGLWTRGVSRVHLRFHKATSFIHCNEKWRWNSIEILNPIKQVIVALDFVTAIQTVVFSIAYELR
jgi:hypothetical protein